MRAGGTPCAGGTILEAAVFAGGVASGLRYVIRISDASHTPGLSGVNSTVWKTMGHPFRMTSRAVLSGASASAPIRRSLDRSSALHRPRRIAVTPYSNVLNFVSQYHPIDAGSMPKLRQVGTCVIPLGYGFSRVPRSRLKWGGCPKPASFEAVRRAYAPRSPLPASSSRHVSDLTWRTSHGLSAPDVVF